MYGVGITRNSAASTLSMGLSMRHKVIAQYLSKLGRQQAGSIERKRTDKWLSREGDDEDTIKKAWA
jgi:hypothetical protein